MAITEGEYICMSCSYKTEWLLHAIDHVNTTNHTMTVTGMVRPGIPKKFCPPVGGSTVRRAPAQAPVQAVVDTGFEELRKKLSLLGVKGG